MSTEPKLPPALHQHVTRPFGGVAARDHAIAPGDLLDTDRAKTWLKILHRGVSEAVYTFQLPLTGPAVPSTEVLGEPLLLFSSYSYLGLAAHPRIVRASAEAALGCGTSTGGVRLLTGTISLHREFERTLAKFLRVEAVAMFSSGYTANLAAVGALFGPGDVCLLDHYAHQSLYAAARLAGCETRRFDHNDMASLRGMLAGVEPGRRTLVAVDGVFSMDGDQAPLAELIALKEEHGAFLLVDEAHALGAVGPTGRGTWEAQGVDPRRIDLITGSLSKGIPSSGGFVAGAADLCMYLQHGSDSYVFSAAPTPSAAAAALEAVRVLDEEPERLSRLRENAGRLAHGLRARGFEIGPGESPIVPLILGDDWRAFAWSRQLLSRGISALAVTFPAVSRGKARLRLCVTAEHTFEQIDRLIAALEDVRDAEVGAAP